MSTHIEDMDREQVEACITVLEQTIEASNKVADQLRAEGIEESVLRMYLPHPKIYSILEKLDDRLKELKEKENASA